MSYTNMKRVSENNFNILQDAREEFRNKASASQTAALMDRLLVTETMVQALFNMLVNKGATKEELLTEIDKINAERKDHTKVPKYYCSKCNKIMQIGNMNPFTANCMYCGELRSIYPYDTVGDLVEGENQPQEEKEKDPFEDFRY